MLPENVGKLIAFGRLSALTGGSVFAAQRWGQEDEITALTVARSAAIA